MPAAGSAIAGWGCSASSASRLASSSSFSASAKGSRWSPFSLSLARCADLARDTRSCSLARSPPTLLKYRLAASTAALCSAGPPVRDARKALSAATPPSNFSIPSSPPPVPIAGKEVAWPWSAAVNASIPWPPPPAPAPNTRPVVRRLCSISSVPRSKPSAVA